ncbi:MAG: hypothetical protein WCO90_12140 [Planctomycetota bacterium]
MNHCLRIFMSLAVFVAVLPVVQAADDGATTWEVIGPVNDGKAIGAIQPSILDLGGELGLFLTNPADAGHRVAASLILHGHLIEPQLPLGVGQ